MKDKQTHLPGIFTGSMLILLGSLILSSCQSSVANDPDFVVADLFATPGKGLATVELTPTLVPVDTLASNASANLTAEPTLPLPTVIILQQPTLPLGEFAPTPTPFGTSPASSTSCTTQPATPFLPIWQNIEAAQTSMGCPVGAPFEVSGVFQFYEYGAMFWRESEQDILILSELAIRQGQPVDNWWRMDDTFQDGVDPERPGLDPPSGMIEPIRGFGKVWSGNGFVREALGWATTGEIQTTVLWQDYEGGWMMSGPSQAPIYVLTPADSPPYSSGTHLGPLP